MKTCLPNFIIPSKSVHKLSCIQTTIDKKKCRRKRVAFRATLGTQKCFANTRQPTLEGGENRINSNIIIQRAR